MTARSPIMGSAGSLYVAPTHVYSKGFKRVLSTAVELAPSPSLARRLLPVSLLRRPGIAIAGIFSSVLCQGSGMIHCQLYRVRH